MTEAVDARRIVCVSPFRCRVWELHDRMEDYVTEETCKEEIDSFRAHGQLVPALGRPVCGDPDHEVEILYGARRLFIARHLGVQLQVELREMSDREALIAMDIENRHRKDTSPYERGRTYLRWIRAGLFTAQDEIAHALNISSSQVSRLLKLAQLPSVIVSAFPNPTELREGWGAELSKAWQNEQMRPMLAQRARALAAHTQCLSAAEIYRRLLAPSGTVLRAGRRQRDEVVLGRDGDPLFRIQHRRNVVAFMFQSSAMSADTLATVREALSDVLQGETV